MNHDGSLLMVNDTVLAVELDVVAVAFDSESVPVSCAPFDR